MTNKIADMPEKAFDTLVNDYLGQWVGSVSKTKPEDAKIFVQDRFLYLLQMFWQARFDKMGASSREMFDWVSANYLPAEASYKGVKFGETLIEHANHRLLSKQVFDQVWSDYLSVPGNGFKTEEPLDFFGKIKNVFGL